MFREGCGWVDYQLKVGLGRVLLNPPENTRPAPQFSFYAFGYDFGRDEIDRLFNEGKRYGILRFSGDTKLMRDDRNL